MLKGVQSPSSSSSMVALASESSVFLHLSPWPPVVDDDLILAMEEAQYEDKCKEIRTSREDIFIGRANSNNEQEEIDGEPDDDEADNGDETDADEFEQETA